MADGLISSQEDGQQDGGRRSSKTPVRPRITPIKELTKQSENWTMFSASQNLPAALNDPLHRETDLFTKTWGDSFVPYAPFPPTSVPTIELGDFLRYLKETAAGRKSHRNIVRETEKGNLSPSSPVSPVSPVPVRQVKQDGRLYDLNNIPKLFIQHDFSLEDPRTFLQIIPLPHILPPSVVSSFSRAGEEDGGNMATLQSTKLLHEKLTHQLDVVEVHLAHQISLRSDVFFSTLASQRQLESLIMQVRQDVLELRHHVRLLDQQLTHPIIKLCDFKQKCVRLSSVCHKLQQIAAVHQTQHTIQLLLGTSDFVGALELIYRTQSILDNELRGIICLRHLGSQLHELEKAIENLMEADFIHVALEDLRSRVIFVGEGERIGSPEEVQTEIQLESIVKGLLRRKKLNFLSALGEELLTSSKVRVKEIVERYLQIPDHGGEEREPDSDDVGLSLGDRMRAMNFESWFGMLSYTFTNLLSYMRCVQKTLSVITQASREVAGVLTPLTPTPTATPTKPNLHTFDNDPDSIVSNHKDGDGEGEREYGFGEFVDQEAEDRLDQLMMDDELSDAHIEALALSTVEETAKHKVEEKKEDEEKEEEKEEETGTEILKRDMKLDMRKNIVTSSECEHLVSECHELLCGVCSLLHSRCTKIINIRAKAGLLDDLVPGDFVRLVRLIGRFIDTSAGITGRQCPHLQYTLLSQAKKFLEHFHETRKSKLSILLDGERWRQSDVPPEIQRVTHTLEEGIVPEPVSEESCDSGRPLLSSQSSIHAEQFLTIHGEKFAVVSVLLLLIKMITEYCQIINDLPMLVTDILGKLVDMLKFFNARTCQLVLGAGAVEVVGLKTITTRHLTLVLRCLQAVMLLIPDIKTHFRKRLTPKKCVLLLQFDQAQEDIGSHCREINHKIITIMDELITKLLAKWEVKSPTPSQCFKTITKQLLKLHEALDDLVPPDHLQALFLGIEQNFKTCLKSHLNKLNITNNGSTEHGIVNSELTHMKGSVGSLDHITAFGSSLFDIWSVNR